MSSLRERLAAVNEILDSGREENLKVAESESVSAVKDVKHSKKSGHGHVGRHVDLGSADEAEEENEDERLRSMKRRAKSMKRFSKPKEDDENDGEILVYGGEGRVSQQAMDNMVSELEAVEKRRSKYRRRRTFDEDRADVNFINEGNRLFNQTLDKYFDKFESVNEIKENLERGTA